MEIKEFYTNYHDRIIDKRLKSEYKLRRYAHEMQYNDFVEYIKPGMKVLDAGCGEGVLSFMIAEKGAVVIGCDISKLNIEKCKSLNNIFKFSSNVKFIVSDLENLPFKDGEFDLVVSSHVLEHLPDFDKGLKEIMRVTKNKAVIAIPTILNLCSFVQVGTGCFWLKGKRSLLALPYGFLKTIFALVSLNEGVNEGYAGQKDLNHIFRFPWILPKKVKKLGYKINKQKASALCLPYFEFLLPLIKIIDRFKNFKIVNNFGYGTTYEVKKTLTR
ncbi:class I SAM-dependent methyltransferase [Candidatus Parcubacteria bacterium]|nr:class I SAM-dependent methyltransferase [Candidatus Parcubacteria bacterium]